MSGSIRSKRRYKERTEPLYRNLRTIDLVSPEKPV